MIWGFVGLVGTALFGYGHLKLQESRASVDWPTANGRIITSRVESHESEDGTTYSADIVYVYNVEGTEHSSDVVVIGGHEYSAHNVVQRYPVDKNVTVSYAPDDVTNAVLEPGVESYFFQKWGISAVAGSLFFALIFNTLLRVAAGEERSLPDKLVIYPVTWRSWTMRNVLNLLKLIRASVGLHTHIMTC